MSGWLGSKHQLTNSLYESLLQPWYNPVWLTGLKAPTNSLSLSLSHTHTHTHTHTIHKLNFFNFFFIQHFAVNFSEKRKITKNFPHSFSSTLFLVQYVLHKRRELHTWYIRTLTFCVTTTAVSLVHLHYLGYTRTWILKSSIQLNQTHMVSIHSSFVQSLHTCSVLTLWLKVTRGTGA